MDLLPEKMDFDFDTDDVDFKAELKEDELVQEVKETKEEVVKCKPRVKPKNDDFFKIKLDTSDINTKSINEDENEDLKNIENEDKNEIIDSKGIGSIDNIEETPVKKTRKGRKRKGALSEKQKEHLEKARIKALEKRREHKRIKDEANKIILEKKQKKKEKLEEAKRIIREKQEEDLKKKQEEEFERRYQERRKKELESKQKQVPTVRNNIKPNKENIIKTKIPNKQVTKKIIQKKSGDSYSDSIYDWSIPTNNNHGFYFN